MKTHENKNLIHTIRDFILNEIISLNYFFSGINKMHFIKQLLPRE